MLLFEQARFQIKMKGLREYARFDDIEWKFVTKYFEAVVFLKVLNEN